MNQLGHKWLTFPANQLLPTLNFSFSPRYPDQSLCCSFHGAVCPPFPPPGFASLKIWSQDCLSGATLTTHLVPGSSALIVSRTAPKRPSFSHNSHLHYEVQALFFKAWHLLHTSELRFQHCSPLPCDMCPWPYLVVRWPPSTFTISVLIFLFLVWI